MLQILIWMTRMQITVAHAVFLYCSEKPTMRYESPTQSTAPMLLTVPEIQKRILTYHFAIVHEHFAYFRK